MQLIARDPLQLRSSWDSYPKAVHMSGGMQDHQPFSTWKFRSDGETKRIIDYIWCVQMTFAVMCSITLLLMSTVCVCCRMCRNTGFKVELIKPLVQVFCRRSNAAFVTLAAAIRGGYWCYR